MMFAEGNTKGGINDVRMVVTPDILEVSLSLRRRMAIEALRCRKHARWHSSIQERE